MYDFFFHFTFMHGFQFPSQKIPTKLCQILIQFKWVLVSSCYKVCLKVKCTHFSLVLVKFSLLFRLVYVWGNPAACSIHSSNNRSTLQQSKSSDFDCCMFSQNQKSVQYKKMYFFHPVWHETRMNFSRFKSVRITNNENSLKKKILLIILVLACIKHNWPETGKIHSDFTSDCVK